MNKKIIIDIGGTHLRYGIIDESLKISSYNKLKSNDNIVNDILNIVKKFSEIKICNVSIGGIVENGKLLYVDKLIGKWKETNLKLELESQNINCIFNIENDGNCAAIAEKFTSSKKIKSLVTFVLGTGIGIGIYYNDKLIKKSEIGKYIENKFCGKLFENLESQEDRNNLYILGSKLLAKEIIRFIDIFNIFNFVISGPISKNDLFFNSLKKESFEKCNIIFKDYLNIERSIIEEQGMIGAYFIDQI
jgi:hexokinase